MNEAPGQSKPAIEIHCEVAAKLNFACHQNSYAVLRDLQIENLSDDEVLENLKVTAESDPGFLLPKSWQVDRIEPNGILPIRFKDLDLSGQFLIDLTESINGSLVIRVERDSKVLAQHSEPIALLAANEWGGAGYMPELLAAFCTPNDSAVDKILHDATNVLRQAGKKAVIDGYQSGSRQRTWEIASAVYAAVANLGISYALPPASFERDGQKIRLPSQILQRRVATCLDMSLLLAAAFEQAGLNPLIALLNGHSLVGVWLQPERLAGITCDEAEVLRKRCQLKELVLIESTLAASSPAPPFSRAVKTAIDSLSAENDANFVAAVDIGRARAHRITPLSIRGDGRPAADVHDEKATTLIAFEEAPALPDFDQDLEEELPTTPDGRIERWQRKLLDLSARNPLLNYRAAKSSIKIFCPNPGQLEDQLAAGAKISISPLPTAATEEQDRELHLQRTGEQIDEAYAADALEQRQVLVDLPQQELQKRLVQIYRKTRSALEEGGANTLYLALGFLLWKRDEKDDKRFRAPLILMPVTLKRQSVRSGVKMLAHDDEPRFNTTLLEMLRRDFAIDISGLDGTLPEDESGIDVEGVWNTVRRAVRDSSGFEVVEDVVLGNFSFAKYLMWKDLVDRTDHLRKNPVVRHLIDTPRDPYRSEVEFVDREEIDSSFKPADFLTPLPADSSQIAAVASAGRGKDFIIIGPPGTGKSQTISNLIAHLLGHDKMVLFVSEKTAALDVVYRRLEEIGLGRFCLELHSNKARKADVLNQLKEAWNSGASRTEEEWEREAEQLEKLRDRLNRLVNHLHRRHPNGLTPHFAMGVKVKDETLAKRVSFAWPSAGQHSEAELARMREVVDLLQVQARAVGDISGSSFQLISHGEWSPDWEREILGSATRLAETARETDHACSAMCNCLDLDLPDRSWTRMAALAEFGEVLQQTYRNQTAYALGADGQDYIEALEQGVGHLKSYAAAQERLSCPYNSMAWRTLDGIALEARWKQAESAWFLKRFFAKRAITKEMQAGGAKGKPNPAIDAEILAILRKEGEAIDRVDRRLNSLRDWEAHSTDAELVESMRDLATRLRSAVGRLVDSPQALAETRKKLQTLLESGNDLLAPDAGVGRVAIDFVKSWTALQQASNSFEKCAGRHIRDHLADKDRSLTAIRELAEDIAKNHAQLNHWCGWQRRRNQALDLDLGTLIDGIESGAVPIDEIPETFQAAYCCWWSERVLAEDEVLRTFSSPEHMDRIKKFREIDEDFLKTTARYVAAELSAGLPVHGDFRQSSQWGVLKREITKRARHKPVRQLLQDAPDAITRLAPCLMMSPLSVAQYLPPEQSLFDIVIFDEASQITVWDAVGSIARGKQVVVAGDPKQMPPTNFFNRTDDDVDGDIDYEGDLESILDELRSSNLPELTLNLHYRSRRESLIAFSNDRYYDNKLVTFPAPFHPDYGVRLARPEGFYDRGKSRTNQGEARSIVDEIVRRLSSDRAEERDQTIGVVTFNVEQQSLIEDLLDNARSTNPDIEWAFSEDCTEPVFVKNLETVQGDERDVILFSITYGPDRAGTVYMNFGPLNREGGERRLNVALTRARNEMVVFSTLHPDSIDLSRTSARAVADLKHFLEYAERGPEALRASIHGSLGDFESPFESAVASGLRDRGWTIHPQIGVSAFRVDLGVVHPDKPGVYLAGVECDGAMYHSTAYARERDKIRQAVLEDLGWTLFRVWSTDWWINRVGALESLHQQLEAHLSYIRDKESDQEVEVGEAHGKSGDLRDENLKKHSDGGDIEKEQEGPLLAPIASYRGDVHARNEDQETSYRKQGDDGEQTESSSFLASDGISHRTPYERAELTIRTGHEQLGELSPTRLVEPIVAIVDAESPIHIDDVIRRVTHAADLQRAGARIQNVVRQAVNQAVRTNTISRRKEFLWTTTGRVITVRDRSAIPPQDKKFDRVAPEEVAEALVQCVERNFSLSKDDAISEAARDLGFQRVTATMQTRLRAILDSLLKNDRLSFDGHLLSYSAADGDVHL